jgi:lipoate-protein ligase B
MPYGPALDLQRSVHAGVVEARQRGDARGPWPLLLVEHAPPVITVSRRAGAREHLLATPETLERLGVQVAETDRGGDITWHGPGQVVAYPIVDLQALGLGIHAYIRALEEAAIRTCARFGVAAHREEGATGVWCGGAGPGARKICAIGVRVSRWVAMHGLALNVRPDLAHFGLIVPCGLHGRAVTSLEREAPAACPDMATARAALAEALDAALAEAAATRPSGPVPS